MVATVADARVQGFAPHREHPVSRGYACAKGLHFQSQLYRQDRALFPVVRGQRETWPDAMQFAGAALREIAQAHGGDSIALYLGNAAGHSLGAIIGATALQRGFGTRSMYSCLTLDNAGQFAVLDAVFGNPGHSFTADYANSDCVVLFGTNPLASQPSQAQSNPDGVRAILRNRQVVVVDPVQTETARAAAWHLAPRPGGDLELLAYILGRCVAAGKIAHGTGALAPALQPFTRQRAHLATDLAESEIDNLVERILEAQRPLIWSGLGVLLGRDGTLGYWLTLCIQAAINGLDCAGGWNHSPGAVDIPRLLPLLGVKGSDPALRSSSGHPATMGTLPAVALPTDILSGRVRALIVVGGNPAVAIPDVVRTKAAFQRLDLLVCLDPFPNQTTALAQVILPPALWPERFDCNLHMGNQRPGVGGEPAPLDWSPPVVPPPGECRSDWEILLDLTRASGARAFGSFIANAACNANTPETLSRLAAMLPNRPYRPRTPNLAVQAYLDALQRRETRTPALTLVTSHRPVGMMNSWIGTPKGAFAHPDTPLGGVFAAAPETSAGERSAESASDANVLRSDRVRPGVLVVPFGDEHANQLTSANLDLDEFTGVPVLNGLTLGPDCGVKTPPAPSTPVASQPPPTRQFSDAKPFSTDH